MWTKHRNRVQRTRFLCIETEFVELGFHTHKLSSLNLIFMSHPCPIHLTVMWVLSWKSSLLNSISVNGPQHSTCCRGSQLGTCFLFVRLTISQILSTLLHVHFLAPLNLAPLSTQSSSLHSSHTTFQVYNILFASFFFFVKKNLEHIRTMFYFILFFC